jgi:EF-P beta-lysylation protein EpmB
MRKGDPDDPLLRQVLPDAAEIRAAQGFVPDPVGDLEAQEGRGLLHKYQGRVLMIASGACAVHCRYCFRREFPYSETTASRAQWQSALAYLRGHREVREVVLSGGDPLTLTDQRLAELNGHLEQIPHLLRIRVHSRLPVVLPERIDSELLAWLGNTRLQRVMVIHANHPRELSRAVRGALIELRKVGVTVLNQSVLLKGVNDTADTLAQLSETLYDAGTLPYYLHMLDKVRGAAHFEVRHDRALEIYRQLQSRLPGYLLPRLVREQAGATAKTLLVP